MWGWPQEVAAEFGSPCLTNVIYIAGLKTAENQLSTKNALNVLIYDNPYLCQEDHTPWHHELQVQGYIYHQTPSPVVDHTDHQEGSTLQMRGSSESKEYFPLVLPKAALVGSYSSSVVVGSKGLSKSHFVAWIGFFCTNGGVGTYVVDKVVVPLRTILPTLCFLLFFFQCGREVDLSTKSGEKKNNRNTIIIC